jgi:hypothetical protein
MKHIYEVSEYSWIEKLEILEESNSFYICKWELFETTVKKSEISDNKLSWSRYYEDLRIAKDFLELIIAQLKGKVRELEKHL